MNVLPPLLAVVLVMAVVVVHHAVTGHHRHLALLRVVRPGTAVPPAAHDAWWHTLSWPRKIAANAALVTASVMTGLAWILSPLVTVTAVLAYGASAVAVRIIRAAHRGRKP